MNNDEIAKIKLPSGYNVDMSVDAHDNYYRDFTESQFFSFNNFINAGLYFPQIMQFVFVVITLLNGKTSCGDILLCNIICGTFYTLIWFLCRFYKIPGLSFVTCFIGSFFFRFFLHYIVFGIIAFVVAKDWKVLLFCIIGEAIAFVIKTIISARLSSVKYHDEVVKYVANFKHK